MRAAFSALTTRGRSFLAAGFAACACGLLLGEVDLLRVGIFVCALPAVTAALVVRTRYRLACSRRVEPARVPAGEAARVELLLENLSRLPVGVLLLEDRLPYSLGGRPRFVLNRLEPHGKRTVGYTVRSDLRGRFPIGPLSLRLTDPLGLVEMHRSFTASDMLVVTPVVTPLPWVRLGGSWSGHGDSHARAVATAGEDDVTTREYRDGDDLRRVHWRSTARYGDLMVRREEQPWESRAVLFLDSRAAAHRGTGPGSSFEWSVSAIASAGVHLARHSFGVRLITDTGEDLMSAGRGSAGYGGGALESTLLDSLALVTTSRGSRLRDGLAGARRTGAGGLVVGAFGALTDDDLDALRRFRHGALRVALVLAVEAWAHADSGEPDAQPTADSERFERTCSLLAASGWRVAPVTPRSDLVALWPGTVGPWAGTPGGGGLPATTITAGAAR